MKTQATFFPIRKAVQTIAATFFTFAVCSFGLHSQDLGDKTDTSDLSAVAYAQPDEVATSLTAASIIRSAKFASSKRYKDVNAYVQAKLKFPSVGALTGSYGTLKVNIGIEADGSIGEVQVLESPGEAFTEAVMSMIAEMPNWTPAYKDNMPVKSNHMLLLRFRLQ